jgi:G:T-mismatch repair DNA endonuclease (very short patch repair protein)
MPRYIIRKIPLTPAVIRARSKSYRVSRYGVWIDPHPEVVGTRPEKMVYAELVKRNIPFRFQDWLHLSLPEFDTFNWYRPDFILPDAKIIIEIQGTYWHTMPTRIESDAFKFAVYELAGWKVIYWWDYDIENRLHDLIMAESRILNYPVRGTPYVRSVKKQYNDSKGIRTMNQRRKERNLYKKQPVRFKPRRSRLF